jgi:mono/diheme cytochrome c family protein
MFSLIMLVLMILSLFSMLELIGREKSRFSPRVLRLLHRVSGYTFLGLALVLSYYCMPFLRATQGKIPARPLLHSLFAIGVIVMLALKILFVRWYKKFMSKVPAFGLTIFCLSLAMIASSGGYYLVISAEPSPVSQESAVEQAAMSAPASQGNASLQAAAKQGNELFQKWCAACHSLDSTTTTPVKPGPGLKGILKREKLPISGRAATPENVRRQLLTPYQVMPPQIQLKNKEIEQLLEFLKNV